MTATSEPLQPPFGMAAGPSMTTPALLSAFLNGATTGASPDACIEDALLMGSDHYVGVRVDVAFLVRTEVHADAEALRADLCAALDAAGLWLVEANSILAGAMAGEMAVPRGFEWDLWARDAEEARFVLTQLAAGDLPSLDDAQVIQRWDQASVEAVLREIERGRR